MFEFAILAIVFVIYQYVNDMNQEKYKDDVAIILSKIRVNVARDVARQNVIHGIFRKHNEQFKQNGLPGPKGNA